MVEEEELESYMWLGGVSKLSALPTSEEEFKLGGGDYSDIEAKLRAHQRLLNWKLPAHSSEKAWKNDYFKSNIRSKCLYSFSETDFVYWDYARINLKTGKVTISHSWKFRENGNGKRSRRNRRNGREKV